LLTFSLFSDAAVVVNVELVKLSEDSLLASVEPASVVSARAFCEPSRGGGGGKRLGGGGEEGFSGGGEEGLSGGGEEGLCGGGEEGLSGGGEEGLNGGGEEGLDGFEELLDGGGGHDDVGVGPAAAAARKRALSSSSHGQLSTLKANLLRIWPATKWFLFRGSKRLHCGRSCTLRTLLVSPGAHKRTQVAVPVQNESILPVKK